MTAKFGAAAVNVLVCACALHAVEPFVAPASTSGSMDVKLYPTENVQTGQSVLVTFGVPFTRGSVTPGDLTKVRVLRGAQEVAAHVEMLTPWRHTTSAGIDGNSVRVALVQIHHTFSVGYPQSEMVTVQWGTTLRTQDVTALVTPRSAWHLVTSGTFTAADSVWEPDVFAVLPKAVLCQGILKFPRMEPFDDTIGETRDDPAGMAPVLHWPGYQEQMYGQKNFFFSIINEDDGRDTAICRYKTDFEPWLFDRSSTMYVLYFRSGSFKPLREAVRAAGYYYNHMTATGFFDLKAGDDAKYSYNECYAYTYWLTGDAQIKQKIATATLAFNAVRTRWTPTMNFWTERHSGFKLLAHTVAYEVLGAGYKDSMLAVFGDLAWLQDGAGGLVPANRVDGGLYHYGAQHDWDWAEDTLGASPWMSMFIMDPALRVYACSEAQSVGESIKRMGGFLKEACAVTSYNSSDGRKMDYPRYAILFDGRDGQADEWTDPQHALEVGTGVACGYYLSALLGAADTSLKSKAQSLYYTYDDGVNGWIRPSGPASGLPAYRVSPWRKYNWEYRPSGGLSWMLKQTAASAAVSRPEASRHAGSIRLAGRSIAGGISLDVTVDGRSRVTMLLATLDGRRIGGARSFDLVAGTHRVRLDVSGIGAGAYVLNVNAEGRQWAVLANLSR